MSVHVYRYFRYVRCYLTSCRITTPSLAHAATHARTPTRGALGRPPPPVLAPKGNTRARLLVSSRVLNRRRSQRNDNGGAAQAATTATFCNQRRLRRGA
eukprot:3073488-Pleurochrysis_carterae.AAC.1